MIPEIRDCVLLALAVVSRSTFAGSPVFCVSSAARLPLGALASAVSKEFLFTTDRSACNYGWCVALLVGDF